MLKRARLLGRLSPRWLRLATCRELGAEADLASLKELLRLGWHEGLLEMARAWPTAQRTRLCAHLLDCPVGWQAAQILLAEEEWRVSAAWSVLQNRPRALDDLVARFSPADPAARSLLLLFAGRLQEYEELDFDRRYLASALENAPPVVRTLLLRHTASLGRSDLVSHQRVPWCRLDWPEFEARLELLGGSLESILAELRADQAARALQILRDRGQQGELEELLGAGVPDPATVRQWLSLPVELGRRTADYASPSGTARITPEGLLVQDWSGREVLLPESRVVEAVFSPDGTHLALDRGGVLALYELGNGALRGTWHGVERFRFGPEHHLAVVERSHVLGSLWTPTVDPANLPALVPGRVMSMAVRFDRVAMGLETGEIALWWGREWAMPYLFSDRHQQPLLLTEFVGPDMLLTGTREEVFLWRVGQPGQLERLQVVARGQFFRFACSAGRLLLAGSDGVLVWSLLDPRRVETLPHGNVGQMGVSGRQAFVSDSDGQVFQGEKSLGWFGAHLRGLYPSLDELVVLTAGEAVRLSLHRQLIELPLGELRQKLSAEQGFLGQIFGRLHRYSIQLGEPGSRTRGDDIQLEM